VRSGRTDKDRFWAVFVINLIIFIAELLVGLYSGSLTMLSDSFHLSIHVIASIVALISEYGFLGLPQEKTKKWSAAVNIFLFFILALVIGNEAWERLLNPKAVNITIVFFLVGIAGLLANWYTVKVLESSPDEEFSENRDILFWEMIYDYVSSIILIACAVIIYFTGWYILDPILSIVLALTMVFKAVQMSLRFRSIHHGHGPHRH